MSNVTLLNCIGFIRNNPKLYFEYHLFTKESQTHILYAYDNEVIILNLVTNIKQVLQGHQHPIEHTYFSNNTIYSVDSCKMISWNTFGVALQECNILSRTFNVFAEDSKIMLCAHQNGTLFYSLHEEIFQIDEFEADSATCSGHFVAAIKDCRMVFYDIASKTKITKNYKSKILKCHLLESTLIVILYNGQTIKYDYLCCRLLKVIDIHFLKPVSVVIEDAIYIITAEKVLKIGFDFKLQYTIDVPNITNISSLYYDDLRYVEYVYCTTESLYRFVKIKDIPHIHIEEISTIFGKINKVILVRDDLVVLDDKRLHFIQNTLISSKNEVYHDGICVGEDLILRRNQCLQLNEASLDIDEPFVFGGFATKEFSIITKSKVIVLDKELNTKSIIHCGNIIKTMIYFNRVYILKDKIIEYQSLTNADIHKKSMFRKFNESM
eukprot:NODE_538_length_6985_cov_0.287892.p1 type:complete len:437 gc:universal NODE_538_length_6985_cov_0.287892:1320-2630(+)